MRLSQLKTGESGIIREVDLEGFMKRRLLDLGFVPGTEIVHVRNGPGGSPVVFKVRDALIALRKKEVNRIFVDK